MYFNGVRNFPHRRTPSDRLLRIFSPSPSPVDTSHELTESDIFWTFPNATPLQFPRQAMPEEGSRARGIPKAGRVESEVRRYQKSAPVNVPQGQGVRKARRYSEIEEEYYYSDKEEEERLAPHEIAAMKKTTTSSVLEGVGRTLKGRDLRQVRDAVWRQSGFVD